MVGCGKGGESWWGISGRRTPFEIGTVSRGDQNMRYFWYNNCVVLEKLFGENLVKFRKTRNVSDALVAIGRSERTFCRVEIFGLKIYLAKQICMKEKRRMKYWKVLAAAGRRQRRRRRRKKRGKKCMRLIF
jgi:hypothetical protein